MEAPYPAFQKIPRLRREVIISEKIDGTNALIHISDDLSVIRAGSRNRWITPEKDNHGFACFVKKHEDELRKLGPGHHYGEWYGAGIQRRYGLLEKKLALFNAGRWAAHPDGGVFEKHTPENHIALTLVQVVPVLAVGKQDSAVEEALTLLREKGSVLVPGFMDPEGIVVYHTAARTLFKVTLVGDESFKGQ